MEAIPGRIVQVLKRAVRREERTSAAYLNQAARARNPQVSEVLQSLAKQEISHANKLLAVLKGRADLAVLGRKGQELAGELHVINDDVRAVERSKEAVQVLRKAVRAEENSGRFYRDLAKIYRGLDVGDLFGRLAEEEDKHKERLQRVLARM